MDKKVKKAGTVLINLSNRKIGLVYRKTRNDYSFPKGHLEEGETLQQCAVRETEEETGRKNHLISNKELMIETYITPSGEDVENYIYIAIDDGESKTEIPDNLKEELVWISPEEVQEKLTYESLKQVWKKAESIVKDVFDNKIPSKLTDFGVGSTCFDKEKEKNI